MEWAPIYLSLEEVTVWVVQDVLIEVVIYFTDWILDHSKGLTQSIYQTLL